MVRGLLFPVRRRATRCAEAPMNQVAHLIAVVAAWLTVKKEPRVGARCAETRGNGKRTMYRVVLIAALGLEMASSTVHAKASSVHSVKGGAVFVNDETGNGIPGVVPGSEGDCHGLDQAVERTCSKPGSCVRLWMPKASCISTLISRSSTNGSALEAIHPVTVTENLTLPAQDVAISVTESFQVIALDGALVTVTVVEEYDFGPQGWSGTGSGSGVCD